MRPRLVGVHRLHHRSGGAEAVHLDHLALFRERGWDCAEFTMDHPNNEPSAWQSYFPARFDPALNLAGLGALPRFFHSTEARQSFARLLDDFRPDIIHIHGIYAHLTNSILKPAVDRQIPIVYTLHDYKLICPASHFFSERHGICEKCRGGRQWHCATDRCTGGSLAKDTLYALEGLVQWHRGMPRNTAARFVGPCKFTVEKFIEHGFPPERMRCIPNFFETTDDVPVVASDIAAIQSQFGRHILFFGRLSAEKGIDVLIDAAANERIPLVIVGDGPKRQALQEQASAAGGSVHFTGHLKGKPLWAHVEAATAVALPSIWYEIAPKSILEAQARSKPTILSAIGGLPELLEDGVSGLLVAPHDRTELAKGLRRLFDMDESSLAEMGRRAKERALTTYTRDRYFSEMVSLYTELVPSLAAA